jgi:hypothetical protein
MRRLCSSQLQWPGVVRVPRCGRWCWCRHSSSKDQSRGRPSCARSTDCLRQTQCATSTDAIIMHRLSRVYFWPLSAFCWKEFSAHLFLFATIGTRFRNRFNIAITLLTSRRSFVNATNKKGKGYRSFWPPKYPCVDVMEPTERGRGDL